MADYDWSQFCRRIDINAAIADIYGSWATQAGLEKWFLRMAEFTTPVKNIRDRGAFILKDDTYRWRWYGWGDEATEEGRILDANGKDFLQFSFAGECVVSVSIKKEEDLSVVELWQRNIPTDEKSKVSWHLGCSTGWTFYLANLKSVLEGGRDLRNKNERLKHVLNS
jgi:hypothetical protein